MSFSTEVRKELARIIPDKECCCGAELSALLIGRGELLKQGENWQLQLGTENATTMRKAYKLIRRRYDWQPTVGQQEERRFNRSRIYTLNCSLNSTQREDLEKIVPLSPQQMIRRQVNLKILGRQCCRRAFIRGLFLCHGFVNRPENSYHLELIVEDSRMAADVRKLVQSMGVYLRQSERKGQLILYLKDAEQIVDFLRIVEASSALLELENVRIVKSMRNQVNRQVNCENANMDKTINASIRQVELIEQLLAEKKFKGLSPQLKMVAVLRVDHPDATLKELGQMMDPPLSKSGIAYRMRRLEEIADRELHRPEMTDR